MPRRIKSVYLLCCCEASRLSTLYLAALLLFLALCPFNTIARAQTAAETEPPQPDAASPVSPPAPRPIVVAEGMPSTGPISYGMENFDSLIPQFLAKWDVPGASLAIVKNERLVFARSYGLANVEEGEKMQPQSRFRLASISKVLTATAILQLVDAGKLGLGDRVLELLPDLKPLPGQSFDPRLSKLTVQNLLRHSTGWTRFVNPEVTYIDAAVARATGLAYPIDKATTIRYLMAQPLQFDPGTKYSYCNFGYMLLGEIIEKVTGQPYESYVRAHILAPTGVRGIRLGHSQFKDRAPSEVHYYTFRDSPQFKSVFDATSYGARPDVGFSMENIAACGGWIASAVDLARFMVAINGQLGRPDVLSPAIETLRNTRPIYADVTAPATTDTEATTETATPPVTAPAATPELTGYYGDGLSIKPYPRETIYWHGGNLSGTATKMCWTSNGVGWVVLFNGRPKDPAFDEEAAALMWKGVREARHWPEGDLFNLYKPEYNE